MFSSERDVALFFAGWRDFVGGADSVLAAHGLGRVHHRVLYIVTRRPGIGVGELARGLDISRQALHRPLSELIRRDLVRSVVAEHSARERTLTATPSGEALERDATGPQLAHMEGVFAAAGPEATQGWREVMRGFAETALSEAPGSVRTLIDEEDQDD
jgi:DNA-binding MarR family transcriptional regulator